jgi:hypothetical protein
LPKKKKRKEKLGALFRSNHCRPSSLRLATDELTHARPDPSQPRRFFILLPAAATTFVVLALSFTVFPDAILESACEETG